MVTIRSPDICQVIEQFEKSDYDSSCMRYDVKNWRVYAICLFHPYIVLRWWVITGIMGQETVIHVGFSVISHEFHSLSFYSAHVTYVQTLQFRNHKDRKIDKHSLRALRHSDWIAACVL